MRQSITKFLLFVFIEHIQQNWSELNKFGKFIIYPFWLIRAIFIWIICPLFIPEYLFKQSNLYIESQKYLYGTELSANNAKYNNTLSRNSILNAKYNKGSFSFKNNAKRNLKK